MDDKQKFEAFDELPGLDIVPENGQLETIIKDKRVFGVYKDEDGADRAIRQLNKLGYSAEDIFIFTQDQAKSAKISEEHTPDYQIMSCSDGSDFIGSSYASGDLVLCVRREPELFRKKTVQANVTGKPQTAMDVQDRMSQEKQANENPDEEK
ncbi:MAG: hypothetical protein WAV55_07775 [Clostridiaceae bacterium]